MGGINFAVPSGASVNMYNPATLIGITMTRFDGSIFIESNLARNGSTSAYSSTANVNQLSLAIPLGSNFAVGLGLSRVARVDYKYHTTEKSFHGFSYFEIFQGDGGIQKLNLTFAGKINSHWTAGASAQYLFGTVNRNWRISWNSPDFANTDDSREEHVHGVRWSVGGLYQRDRYRIGAFIALSSQFKNNLIVTGIAGDTSYAANRKTGFPAEIGLGGMVAIGKEYSVGMDILYTGWHSITSFDSTQKNRNTMRIGLGAEKAPSSSLSAGFFGKASYRAGFYYQNLYATNASGKFGNEYFATLGMGIPFNKGKSMLDLGIEMGLRGSIAVNSVQDRILRFTLSVSGGERWFQNRRKR
jgi:long-subunit fatty acid transport protein